jgi:hypothetical protein
MSDGNPEQAPGTRQSERQAPTFIALDSRMLRRSLVLIIGAVLLLALIKWAWEMLAGFLFLILLSWLIAISFDPVVSFLARHRMSRGLATAIVAIVVLGSIGAFIALLGGALATQVVELILALPELILQIVNWINKTFDANIDPVQLTNSLNLTPAQIASFAGSFAGGFFGVFFSVVGFVFEFVTVLVFSFYLSSDAPRIKRFIASWLRPERQVVFIRIWDISVRKAGGFVISKLALAMISAVFHCAFFFIIDIPYWLPMGIFAGVVAQFIPTIGTYIGVALPALFAVFEQPLDVLWIIIFATVYQQIENYVLTPRISTKTMDINSGVALASVFVGAALFGPIGAIIGIPLAAIVIAIIEAYGQRYELHPEVAAHLT